MSTADSVVALTRVAVLVLAPLLVLGYMVPLLRLRLQGDGLSFGESLGYARRAVPWLIAVLHAALLDRPVLLGSLYGIAVAVWAGVELRSMNLQHKEMCAKVTGRSGTG